MVLFKDYISLNPFNISDENRNLFFDSIMENIDAQKNEKPSDSIVGLKVTAAVTHSAKLTGHYHFYTPSGVVDGVHTFTTPYKKPVLAHHNAQNDAIGRIQSSVYVATPSSEIDQSIQDSITQITYFDKKSIKLLRKIRNKIYDKSFTGLGYVEASANIVNEKSIDNILNGIYHTISIGYGTDALVCSECGTDWFGSGKTCDHSPGVDYGHGPMFLIFGKMQYDEFSYVNKPADDLAANLKVAKESIDIANILNSLDSVSSIEDKKKIISLYLGYDSSQKCDPSRISMCNLRLHTIDSNGGLIIPEYNQTKIINNGENMTLKKLKDSEDLYKIISEHLPEEKILEKEELEKLKDSDFVGKRLFPAIDEDHINAAKKVLESLRDSKEKAELIEFLDERLSLLNINDKSDSTDDNSDSESNTNSNSDGGVNSDDNKDNSQSDGSDTISYSFELSGHGWGLPDNKDPDSKAEKEILDLLLKLYASKKDDAVSTIESIVSNLKDEDKDEVVKTFAKDLISEYESRLDNYKNEKEIWDKSKEALEKTIDSTSIQLKKLLVDNLLEKSNTDGENPSDDIDSVKSKLEEKTIQELLAIQDGISTLFGSKPTKQIKKEDNDTERFTDNKTVYTEESIKDMEEKVYNTYLEIRRNNQQLADSYLEKQKARIAKLKDSITDNKKDN